MEMPKIKVADFEGPFDLLLHLIKKQKMDIYNVEIYKITAQYLKYLEEMKSMDLDITSEFIVVAASLIEIKSKKLLPVYKDIVEDEEDIEKNLLEKLIEYKKIKEAALYLKSISNYKGDVYTKKPEIIEEKLVEKKEQDLFKNLTLIDLYNMYTKLLDEYLDKQNKDSIIENRIYLDKYKVEDKMEFLFNLFYKNKIVKFKDIIKETESKMEAIVTFLALLELIKIKVVSVYQEENFTDILIERRGEFGNDRI